VLIWVFPVTAIAKEDLLAVGKLKLHADSGRVNSSWIRNAGGKVAKTPKHRTAFSVRTNPVVNSPLT
jgi:hypothetical protein